MFGVRTVTESMLRQENPFDSAGGGGGSDSGGDFTRGPDGLWRGPDGEVADKWIQDYLNQQEGGATDAGTGLVQDLLDLGLLPYEEGLPQAGPVLGKLRDQNIALQRYNLPYAEDPSGATWRRTASGGWEVAPQWQQGAFGGGDPYAGAANARAERALNEQIRQNRLGEVYDAISAIMARDKARLDASAYTVPQGTGGYFPGFMPSSPVVRSGLSDPLRYTPVAYLAPNEDQIAKDLARIRGIAGVG